MTQDMQYLATVIFGLAILHTFLCNQFQKIAHHYPSKSIPANLFHVLGEVEAVFGIWAGLFIVIFGIRHGFPDAIAYVESIDFTEPAFVFVIMAAAATRSIRALAIRGISVLAVGMRSILPFINVRQSFYFICLGVAPLIGSFITEPAIMTVLALILRDRFYQDGASDRFKYFTLATLFVNVSIGGTLTNFAAPPVVMVARVWNWDNAYMFSHFGLKAAIAVLINAGIALWFLRNEFKSMGGNFIQGKFVDPKVPLYVTIIHILFLIAVVATAHHMVIFLGLFLFFIGVLTVTEPHQDPLALRESLLVGFFLGGLVILGKPQEWWLSPLLQSLSETPLFIGTTLLTAITDNAALTYLGAQVQGLSEPMKIALLEGAVTGGGLTVIANAPNPAGYGILKGEFGQSGMNPFRLFVYALVPTLIAAIAFRIAA